MTRKATIADAEKIAEELRGQCLTTLEDIIEREGLDEISFPYDHLDSLVFNCNDCGWWCEISEMTNDEDHDWTCTDCNPDLA